LRVLVVGASGATGRLLVNELLVRGHGVTVIVRNRSSLPGNLRNHDQLTIVDASLLSLSAVDIAHHVRGCDAVASCLGHTMSLKGIFGSPRKLVTEATRRICAAIKENKPDAPVRFVLMNTAGKLNPDASERISFGQICVIGLLRLLLPPHADNEQAADYLRTHLGQNDRDIEWSAVRPDTLIDRPNVSDYDVHASPTRSAIFNAGTTSRINVAHFMADLITDHATWRIWQGKMPVLYNRTG
jgi:putative NADH-flavin reductase